MIRSSALIRKQTLLSERAADVNNNEKSASVFQDDCRDMEPSEVGTAGVEGSTFYSAHESGDREGQSIK